VTRLADVTRLDVIGLPVWQAVRPWSRALSVHQGKGASDDDARLGALLEAVESHAAESFAAETMRCAFRALPDALRAPDIGDFAAQRSAPPAADAPVEWVPAERVNGGGELFLPRSAVSLDMTTDLPSRFERTSNGLATGATFADALMASLHELIERDAVGAWQSRDLEERIFSVVDLQTIGYDWLEELIERIKAAGAVLRCYRVPSPTGTPVFACEINDWTKAAAPYRTTNGRGAHPLPEIALFRAVAEAVQSRATFIAGARDDLYPWRYAAEEKAITIAFGLPAPPGIAAVDFHSVEPGPQTLSELVAALERAGFPNAAAVTLAQPQGLCVVRSFVCGFASLTRGRRPVSL
jgi:ribosomal protein S12 methylthiotransferase accessory factor